VTPVKKDAELYAFRRHITTCKYFGPGGREVRADKCTCPFHVDGLHHAQRVRRSLKTRSRQIADRRLGELKLELDAQLANAPGMQTEAGARQAPGAAALTVSDAVERFLETHGAIGPEGKYQGDSERGTWKKYRCALRLLASFCERIGIKTVVGINLDSLEDYRKTRSIGKVSWKVERQTLITFFGFCVSRKWISTNPAKELKAPRNLKPNEVVPYTLQEESQILKSCDEIGGGKYNRSGAPYEQLRARAMIMLLRHTALRVSDVCTLRKDAISWDPEQNTWRVFLYTQKTGDPVFLPIPAPLKLVLDALPLPRSAPQNCPYYFWNGQSSRRAVVGIAERTLSAVFKKSGVKDAHAHRYRHTLATRLLEQGATFEQVADIPGNSPAVVRKHYGKWSKGRQANIDRLMMAHFQSAAVTNSVTNQSHEKTGAVN
jgi:site-specific recombinase XerD